MDTSDGDVFAQLESAVANWGAQLEETEARLREAVTAPDADGAVAQALQREVQELRETVESLLGALEAQRADDAPSAEPEADPSPQLEELTARCQELEAEAESLRRERDELRAALEAKDAGAKGAEMPTGLVAFDAEGRRRRLGEILLEANLISEKQLTEALREQKWTRRRRLGDILIERGVASEVLVGVVLANQLRLPFVNLDDVPLDEYLTRLIPAKLALRHNVIPLREEEGTLVVATPNPLDLIALDDIEMACGMPVKPVVGAASAIRARLSQYIDLES